MKKAWIYKRKGVKGWWIGWYESGKRKAKALPSKALAEHFRQIKYTQLNSDVFTGTVTIDWPQIRDEYVHSKKVAGCVEASIYEVALTLRHFERLVGKCNSKQITKNAIDKYILKRGKEVIRSTVNKDIRNLRAFINWCRKNRYVNGEIEVKELKEDERPVKSLSNTQIKKLLSTSKPYKTLWMRILLALGTDLRRRDIESWSISDIDFENSYVTTRSQKSRKSMGSRPVRNMFLDWMLNRKSYLMIISAGTDGRRYVRNLDWMISHFMIYARPLVLCLLGAVYPQLSYRNCWSTLHRILLIRCIRMLILSCGPR
jgi:integrase